MQGRWYNLINLNEILRIFTIDAAWKSEKYLEYKYERHIKDGGIPRAMSLADYKNMTQRMSENKINGLWTVGYKLPNGRICKFNSRSNWIIVYEGSYITSSYMYRGGLKRFMQTCERDGGEWLPKNYR